MKEFQMKKILPYFMDMFQLFRTRNILFVFLINIDIVGAMKRELIF